MTNARGKAPVNGDSKTVQPCRICTGTDNSNAFSLSTPMTK